MGIPEMRLQMIQENVSDSNQSERSSRTRKRLLKNFEICQHCEKKGRSPVVERLNEAGPVISRSDGESFHLVLGDRPISFPAEKSSGKTGMMSAGFWYVKDRDDSATHTETVVVILRDPPERGVALMRHLESVADKLAEKLGKADALATLYEYDNHSLHRVS
ncbi:MAG TPA: hypothetical protein VMI32_12980 [Candidatus Solibacter sp.]|nr:hypothetical protein [Candidatus Solibacter sp.]